MNTEAQPITTGIPELDAALGVGGYPADRIVGRPERMGRYVADLRIRLDVAQLDAAERAGMSQQAWSRLELGRDVRFSTLDRALLALGVDLFDFLPPPTK